jgi:hypothetical protein
MMDSKQTPQQRIEQDGKVYEWTGERRLPKRGEYFLGERLFKGRVTRAGHDFTDEVRYIYRALAQASEEARPTAEQVVNGEEVVKTSDSRKLAEDKPTPDELLERYKHRIEIINALEDPICTLLASRDEELRRLREELQTQRAMTDSFCKRATELASEKANVLCDAQRLIDWINSGAKSASTAFTEGPDRNVAYAIESQLAAANEQVEKLKGELNTFAGHHAVQDILIDEWKSKARSHQATLNARVQECHKLEAEVANLHSQLATLERHYSEARGLVNFSVLPEPGRIMMEPLVCYLDRLAQFDSNKTARDYASVIRTTLTRHDQERAACKPCGEPLTLTEAEKICAGEPVRQPELEPGLVLPQVPSYLKLKWDEVKQ